MVIGITFIMILLIYALWTLASSNNLKDDEE
jgi:hypothetical protein